MIAKIGHWARRVTAAACLATGLVGVTSGVAQAQGPVVVELFTSQGCSSCPPADALLADLAQEPGVIALSLHVDYWDYIGWTDTFGNPAHSARQWKYAERAQSTVVYTPQMVIAGQTPVMGHRPMAVISEVMAHQEARDAVLVTVERTGAVAIVQAELRGPAPEGGMVVQLVGFIPHASVDIGRGENANRTLDYHNVVTSWQVIDEWSGGTPHRSRIELPEDRDHVVIVQAADNGPILGAAHLSE